ncbi:hypothetical protein K502DRAFT_345354 [Neoconidiobolus thromboides FSU 785]|nr:hypothetical protein K502DRAFT_345354 [Neoconidiobolus thromboides FSU 785]
MPVNSVPIILTSGGSRYCITNLKKETNVSIMIYKKFNQRKGRLIADLSGFNFKGVMITRTQVGKLIAIKAKIVDSTTTMTSNYYSDSLSSFEVIVVNATF